MNPLRGKAKILAIASIVLIITISYGLFFYLQNTNETNTRNSIFEQQKAHQMQSTQALSQRISSDLELYDGHVARFSRFILFAAS